MKRTFQLGFSAAIIGGLGLWLGGVLGLSFQNTVMGVGGGVILALIRQGSPIARLIGFVIGFLLGVFFAAMELGVLPGGDSVAGIAVALGVIMLVITLVSGFTRARISAWSMLLGALTFLCGFIGVIESTPWTAAQQLPTSFCTLLAMAMIGFLTVIPVELLADEQVAVPLGAPTPPAEPDSGSTSEVAPGAASVGTEASTSAAATSSVGLDEIIGGDK